MQWNILYKLHYESEFSLIYFARASYFCLPSTFCISPVDPSVFMFFFPPPECSVSHLPFPYPPRLPPHIHSPYSALLPVLCLHTPSPCSLLLPFPFLQPPPLIWHALIQPTQQYATIFLHLLNSPAPDSGLLLSPVSGRFGIRCVTPAGFSTQLAVMLRRNIGGPRGSEALLLAFLCGNIFTSSKPLTEF